MEEFSKLFSGQDILLHIINTVILFVAIRLLVYKPVRRFLDARTERVSQELAHAAEKQAQADQLLKDAGDARNEAALAAAQAQTEGAARAQETGEQLLVAARAQAEEIITKAQEDAAAIKASAQEEIQMQALSMAVEIAEKMIGRELAQKDNATLARDFLTKVG